MIAELNPVARSSAALAMALCSALALSCRPYEVLLQPLAWGGRGVGAGARGVGARGGLAGAGNVAVGRHRGNGQSRQNGTRTRTRPTNP